MISFYLLSRVNYFSRGKERRSTPNGCCFNKHDHQYSLTMSLRDQQEPIVESPLLRSTAATSLYPEDPVSSKAISKPSNCIFDHSVDDGTVRARSLKRPCNFNQPGLLLAGLLIVHVLLNNKCRSTRVNVTLQLKLPQSTRR